MESASDGLPRIYVIKKSQHLGYGFVAGGESPTMVKSIEPNGPSYKRLLPGDVLMAVNGIQVDGASREEIIKMIQLCDYQIEIKVRQATYEEHIRARNLADPKFYTLNKSSNLSQPVNRYINRQAYPLPLNPSPLNRLVTSISQQQKPPQEQQHHLAAHSPFSYNDNGESQQPPVQINNSKTVLKQKLPSNGTDLEENHNFTRTLGRNGKNYGRHSPLPQRCKSSMDIAKNGQSNKNSSDADNDQPMLKRSNTMRPIKLPPKIMEIIKAKVIRVYFEDGRTRVLNYDESTTAGDILEKLNSRTEESSIYSDEIKRYFGLAVTFDVTEGCPKEQQLKQKLLHILDENDCIVKIRDLPYALKLRFIYSMVYPPADVSKLYIQDKLSFEYLYQQSCNDLKLDKFRPELDQEVALKLSALRLLEYVHSNYSKAHENNRDPKVYMKLIKKAPGIEYFLPVSIVQTMLDKKGKRIVGQYKKLKHKLNDQIKKNFEEFEFEPPKVRSTTDLNRYSKTSFHELSLPEIQSSSSDCIKLSFLNYLSQLPCYGISKRPIRTSTSPVERSSAEGCSSSLESVPRTSDSSPLIRQDRNLKNSQNNLSRVENPTNINISRLAQMNSIRSLSSVQSSSISQPIDQPDLAQTPSIESISSITFNMQNSPSPQQPPVYSSQTNELYPNMMSSTSTMNLEPSPMPRQQINASKSQDYNSIDKLYNQRYTFNHIPIEELLKNVILLPPPPPPTSSLAFNDLSYPVVGRQSDYRQNSYLTQVLTDKDIEKLRVPPPPRMIN